MLRPAWCFQCVNVQCNVSRKSKDAAKVLQMFYTQKDKTIEDSIIVV